MDAFDLAEAFHPFDQRSAVCRGGGVFQPEEYLVHDHLPLFADVMEKWGLCPKNSTLGKQVFGKGGIFFRWLRKSYLSLC
jgi:hypothetical protein